MIRGLFDNDLRGTLPASFSQLTALQSLDLAGNRLSGSLPPAVFASTTAMQYLSLYDNHFSAKLPATLGSLAALTTLCVVVAFRTRGLSWWVAAYASVVGPTASDYDCAHAP